MIPTQFWTNEYIVPPFYPHNYYIVRIFSDHDNTVVQYYNSTLNNTAHLSQGMMVEIMFGSDPAVIVSNKPISVIQYLADNENMYGNPCMITSQGLSQFNHRYTFSTPPIMTDFGSYTLAITILKSMSNGLELFNYRREILGSYNTRVVPVPFPLHDYITMFYNISMSDQYLIIEHERGVKFGAILYSVESTIFGYGINLQLALSECLTNVSHSVPSYSTNTFTGNKTWCFQCDDMTHLQYCDSVTECKGNDEVCFVEKYKKHGSVQLYKSGCMEKSMCHSVGVNIECQQCCDGMFCNIEGCGDEDLPALGNRGPFCFACGHHGENDVCTTVQMCAPGQVSHHGENDVCTTVQMCAPGQVCQTEMYVWGSGHHCVKGCVDQQLCRAKRDVSDVDKRSTPTCLSCCHEDFCNTNCIIENGVALVG